MDVKSIMRGAKKHHFWILCGTVSLVAMVVWFFFTAGLAKETESRTSEIQSSFTDGQGILAKENHPNTVSHEKMDELNDSLSNEVLDAWEFQYLTQQEILKWPTELREVFIEVVRPLQPIEATVPYHTEH